MSRLEQPTNEACAIAEQGGGRATKVEQLIQQYCPDGVEYKKLEDVCLMERGTSATKGTMQEGDIPVISGGRQPAFYCSQSNRTGETITVAGSGAGQHINRNCDEKRAGYWEAQGYRFELWQR